MNNKEGYILVLTLMIISILIIVINGVFYNSIAEIAFTKIIVDREKAKILALSGIQLAISKLTVEPAKKETSKKTEDKKEESKNKKLLAKILPRLNRWEKINLKEDIDGIEGQIKICISSEDGKININKFFDYEKHKFITVQDNQQQQGQKKQIIDSKQIIQRIFGSTNEFIKNKDLFIDFNDFLQKRKWALYDISELISIPKFNYFQDHLFYEQQINNEKKQPIYLSDIFTIWTDSEKIQPWLFSDSLCALLGLKRVKQNDENERNENINSWLKNFKENNNWKQDWDKILKPVYGKDFKTLPKNIEFFLADNFTAKTFSVISYGTVGLITQKIVAILELDAQNKSTGYTIKKIYWN